jgi:hypothetical protein
MKEQAQEQPEVEDLETEINRIKATYPEHSINIEYNHKGGYWAVAVAQGETYDRDTIVAFGGSRETLREAVMNVKPVERATPKSRRKRGGPSNG